MEYWGIGVFFMLTVSAVVYMMMILHDRQEVQTTDEQPPSQRERLQWNLVIGGTNALTAVFLYAVIYCIINEISKGLLHILLLIVFSVGAFAVNAVLYLGYRRKRREESIPYTDDQLQLTVLIASVALVIALMSFLALILPAVLTNTQSSNGHILAVVLVSYVLACGTYIALLIFATSWLRMIDKLTAWIRKWTHKAPVIQEMEDTETLQDDDGDVQEIGSEEQIDDAESDEDRDQADDTEDEMDSVESDTLITNAMDEDVDEAESLEPIAEADAVDETDEAAEAEETEGLEQDDEGKKTTESDPV